MTGFGFFHTYINDGSDGERVSWCIITAIQKESSNLDYVYNNDHDASSNSLMACVVQHFGDELHHPLNVMYLYQRKWI